MDPLSITAGVLAVLGAARGAVQCLRKIKDVRKAPLEVADLLQELNRFCTVLEGILQVVESVHDADQFTQASILTEHVVKANQLMDDMTALLNTSSLLRLNLSDENTKRALWFRHKTKIKSLNEELKAIRLDLCLALHTLTAYEKPNNAIESFLHSSLPY